MIQVKFVAINSDASCTRYSKPRFLMRMSIYSYTFDFDTFKSVTFRNDHLDHFDTFGENFDVDTFENDTFESCLSKNCNDKVSIANFRTMY